MWSMMGLIAFSHLFNREDKQWHKKHSTAIRFQINSTTFTVLKVCLHGIYKKFISIVSLLYSYSFLIDAYSMVVSRSVMYWHITYLLCAVGTPIPK